MTIMVRSWPLNHEMSTEPDPQKEFWVCLKTLFLYDNVAALSIARSFYPRFFFKFDTDISFWNSFICQ